MTDSPPSKRLLFIGQGIDGGIAPLVSTLAYGMCAAGWDCAVRYVGRPASSMFVATDTGRGISSQAITTGKARSLSEVWGLICSVRSIWRTTREHRPHVIIFAGFIPTLLYAPILRQISSARFIFWDHAPQNTFLAIKKLFFPLALRSIDRIVSISHSTAAAMAKYFGVAAEKVTIIANGVNSKPWQDQPPASAFQAIRVIMPARFDLNQKDPITLIKAVVCLHRQGVDIEATLVGSGVDEEKVGEAIRSEVANDYIHLITHSDDMPSLVARHNVVCLSTKFEGLPTVIIEGMLARRIVVASRVAGCVDIIRDGENGFLFDAGSVDDCAAKLKALITISNPRQIIDRAYRRAIDAYSPDVMVANFQRVLSE